MPSLNQEVIQCISSFDPSSTFTKSELANEMNIPNDDPRSAALSSVLSKLAKRGILEVKEKIIEEGNYFSSNVYGLSKKGLHMQQSNNVEQFSVPVTFTLENHKQEEPQEGMSTTNLVKELTEISERLRILAQHEALNDLSMYTTKELMAELETRVK